MTLRRRGICPVPPTPRGVRGFWRFSQAPPGRFVSQEAEAKAFAKFSRKKIDRRGV
jgi:hypothetical protein